MVKSFAEKIKKDKDDLEVIDIPKEDVNWSTVSLNEVLNRGNRLEAGSYNLEMRKSNEILKKCKYPLVSLVSDDYVIKTYNGSRTKRNYISKDSSNAKMFLGGSEILDIYPKTKKYLDSSDKKYSSYKIKEDDILLTCSGTIGKMSYVSKTLKDCLVSQHVIKLRAKDLQGYIYAYLKTDLAQNLIKSNKYGSLVSHIEPEHLEEILIPNPPYLLKRKVHDLIINSYRNRDESNRLIDEATKLLISELGLPSIEEMRKETFSGSSEMTSFNVKLSDLNNRLEGSYHEPIIGIIEKYLEEKCDLRHLSDKEIVKNIILPGRFTRIYVDKKHGVPFIGGKDLFQLKSETGKYLSKKAHSNRLNKELLIRESSIILPARGTIGQVMLSMPHQIGKCAISDNLIQIEFDPEHIGYLFIFLNSEYGKYLIYRQKYGGVVNALEPVQLEDIKVPVLKNKKVALRINNMVSRLNELRYLAYKQEEEAIKIINKEIIGI